MGTMSKYIKHVARRFSGDQAGQSLVEFAIMSIILTVILMGILDLGRAYFAFVALQDVVAEGATFAAVNPTCIGPMDGPGCSNPNNITWRAKNESPSGMVISTSIEVQVSYDPAGPVSGKPVTVTASYQHPLLTFVIASIVGDDILPLQASSSASIP